MNDDLRTPELTPVRNETIDTQMRHRSFRSFTDEKLSPEQVETLLEVARHTATTAFLQQFTIIHVLDPQVREQIYAASGQPYVGGNRGNLFVFVVDLYRNSRIRSEGGMDNEPLERMNLFLEAAQDTMLAAQNVVIAAESLGLGTVYLGSINADPRLVIQALDLPRYTYPLVGLLVGYPAEEPQFKPRLPRAVTTGVDRYPYVSSYEEALAGYDEVLQRYYDMRDTNKRVDSFTHQIRTKVGKGPSESSPVLSILNEQGLVLY